MSIQGDSLTSSISSSSVSMTEVAESFWHPEMNRGSDCMDTDSLQQTDGGHEENRQTCSAVNKEQRTPSSSAAAPPSQRTDAAARQLLEQSLMIWHREIVRDDEGMDK